MLKNCLFAIINLYYTCERFAFYNQSNFNTKMRNKPIKIINREIRAVFSQQLHLQAYLPPLYLKCFDWYELYPIDFRIFFFFALTELYSFFSLSMLRINQQVSDFTLSSNSELSRKFGLKERNKTDLFWLLPKIIKNSFS